MEHLDAERLNAVEQYLLDELPPPLRDEFEEHFFDCPDCAADLRTTAAFMDAAKRELIVRQSAGAWQSAGARQSAGAGAEAQRPSVQPGLASRARSWFSPLFKPAFVSPVFAMLLMVILYQNFAVDDRPEVLPVVSLVGGNSRGSTIPSVAVAAGRPILLSLDVPAREEFSTYTLHLVSPAGATIWQLAVTADQARDTVSVRIPTTHWSAGEYNLVVHGETAAHGERAPGVAGATPGANATSAVDVARYRFVFINTN